MNEGTSTSQVSPRCCDEPYLLLFGGETLSSLFSVRICGLFVDLRFVRILLRWVRSLDVVVIVTGPLRSTGAPE